MLVQCPSCHTTYKIADAIITTPTPTFRCSRCKHIFVVGSKTEVGPPNKPAAAPPPPQPAEKEPELTFSSSSPEKAEATKKEIKGPSETSPETTQPQVTEPTDEGAVEFANVPPDEPFSPPVEAPRLRAVQEEAPPATKGEQSSQLNQERDDSWSLTPSQPQEEEPFTIPEENRSLAKDSALESRTDFEDDWQDSYPLLEEREASPSLDRYRDRPLSVVPYITLFGALLLIYAMLTLMYQARPNTIESIIKLIPWLDTAVLKNNHLRHGITLQSLRPGFQTIQGNREVFVLAGEAVNRNPVSVREVRVEGHIFNAEGKEIDRQTISVGNAISSKIIRDLTAQEISILQRLNPQKRFEISPDESASFVIVFLKPSAEVKNFSCRVLSVDAGA